MNRDHCFIPTLLYHLLDYFVNYVTQLNLNSGFGNGQSSHVFSIDVLVSSKKKKTKVNRNLIHPYYLTMLLDPYNLRLQS